MLNSHFHGDYKFVRGRVELCPFAACLALPYVVHPEHRLGAVRIPGAISN